MTDYSKNRQTLGRDAFALFLERLSNDTVEAGDRYNRLREKLVGFFSLKGVSDPGSAADETIDRAVAKITAGAPVSDVGKYCSGIARNIAKERLRLERREKVAFQHFIEDLEVNAPGEQVERIQRLLKPCFEQLAVEDQTLLLAYCQDIRGRARAEHRRQLAETMKTTVLGLRIRVTRLRTILAGCVKKLSHEA